MPDKREPDAGTSAAVGPVVVTVRVALPAPLATVIAPTEQDAAGLTVGLTLQVNVTPAALNPFIGVTVTVEVVDDPGATEDGVNGDAESEKSALIFCAFEVLPAKVVSPM